MNRETSRSGMEPPVDIEDRKRAESLIAVEKQILEMVAKGDSPADILDSLCRLVEERASGVLASVLLLDGDRLKTRPAPGKVDNIHSAG
jgi:hypothetical protein